MPFGDDFPYKNHDSRVRSQWGRYNFPRYIKHWCQKTCISCPGWMCQQTTCSLPWLSQLDRTAKRHFQKSQALQQYSTMSNKKLDEISPYFSWYLRSNNMFHIIHFTPGCEKYRSFPFIVRGPALLLAMLRTFCTKAWAMEHDPPKLPRWSIYIYHIHISTFLLIYIYTMLTFIYSRSKCICQAYMYTIYTYIYMCVFNRLEQT